MSMYNEEYYLVFPDYEHEENVGLKPDKKTSKSGFGTEILPPGRPLFFSNASPEYIPEGKTEVITDVMFGMGSMVVNEKIKSHLEKFKIDGLQFYPAVYVGLNGSYHERLWFLNFYSYLDCWDRDMSKYFMDDEDPDEPPTMEIFSLDSKILDSVPEESRLIFSMGGLDIDYIFIHKKIADFLTENNITGIRLIPVTEYELGIENFPPGEF